MASCRDPEAATRKNILAPVNTTQEQTSEVKIIRMPYLKLQREKPHKTNKKKTSRKGSKKTLLSLKNLLPKHLRLGENIWNSGCALKFSIAQLWRSCECPCVQRAHKEWACRPLRRGRPQSNKLNFNPAWKHFPVAGWLSEEQELVLLSCQLCCFWGKWLFSWHHSFCLCSDLRR